MTTKNEYIASIMLEAADLLKSDDLNESIHMMSKDERSAIKNNKKNMKSASIKQLYKAASTGNPDAVRAWANAMKKIVSQTSNNYELYDIGCDLEFSLAKASKRNMPELQRAISAIVQTIKNKLSIPRAMSINDAYDKMTNKSIEDKKNEKMQRKMEKKNKKESKKALQEAINLLYDKAILCEDAAEAEGYVQKAEELQQAIEDIPEETPVKQDDYETSAVGGDDEKPDLEEIRDLCDGDEEVMKLLTDDEDKSVTVDSDGETNTESYSWFY